GTNTRRGTPWNPWDATTHRTPGGSSSGSGVAVASGMASCAIGTDTGGSVRIPAGWCGIVGLKVTEGRLPLEGIVPLSHTLDTPGPMARTVADATLMYETLLGRPPDAIDADIAAGSGLYGQINAGVAGLRMGALSAVAREGVDAAVLADYDAALARLKALGAEIVTFDLPVSASDMARGVGMIISAEGYYHHGSLYEDPANAMDEHVRPRIMAGAKISARDYVAVRQQMQTNRRATLAAMHDAKLAVFLTPTITTPPVPVADADQTKTPAGFTRAVNYLGFCAMSVPMGLAGANLPTGLPTSLHVVARGGDEAMAIRVSGAFERDRGPFPPPPMALG
ncbi:MAG TPA: amidase, partial [Hyphomicrobiaceae bacterium]|nr:amidase [Hyphomicrobiaceae bacterium]